MYMLIPHAGSAELKRRFLNTDRKKRAKYNKKLPPDLSDGNTTTYSPIPMIFSIAR